MDEVKQEELVDDLIKKVHDYTVIRPLRTDPRNRRFCIDLEEEAQARRELKRILEDYGFSL